MSSIACQVLNPTVLDSSASNFLGIDFIHSFLQLFLTSNTAPIIFLSQYQHCLFYWKNRIVKTSISSLFPTSNTVPMFYLPLLLFSARFIVPGLSSFLSTMPPFLFYQHLFFNESFPLDIQLPWNYAIATINSILTSAVYFSGQFTVKLKKRIYSSYLKFISLSFSLTYFN